MLREVRNCFAAVAATIIALLLFPSSAEAQVDTWQVLAPMPCPRANPYESAADRVWGGTERDRQIHAAIPGSMIR